MFTKYRNAELIHILKENYLNKKNLTIDLRTIAVEDHESDEEYEEDYPVDTGRKLNVHKTFRRRPGRLLNVLCTFNLRPVSKGYADGYEDIELNDKMYLMVYEKTQNM